jgi:hypothetical protein
MCPPRKRHPTDQASVCVNMDDFRLIASDIPARLYRVTYPNSTPFSKTTGFKAREQSPVNLASPDQLRTAVEFAFTWSSRVPSPFIAVFSEKDHAKRWAISCCQRGEINVAVVEIDAAKLTDIKVLKLSTLVRELDVRLSDGAAQHESGAYLCLKEIPPKAIISVSPVSELQMDSVSRSKSGG